VGVYGRLDFALCRIIGKRVFFWTAISIRNIQCEKQEMSVAARKSDGGTLSVAAHKPDGGEKLKPPSPNCRAKVCVK